MNRDQESILQEALKCFKPRLTVEQKCEVRDELIYLASVYRNNSTPVQSDISVTITYFLEREGQPPEKVIRQIPPPKRPGRPRNYAADRLVYDCKTLLKQYNCRHYATGDRYTYKSPLSNLARLVHELAGFPSIGGWQNRAEIITKFQRLLPLLSGENAPPKTLSFKMDQIFQLIAENLDSTALAAPGGSQVADTPGQGAEVDASDDLYTDGNGLRDFPD